MGMKEQVWESRLSRAFPSPASYPSAELPPHSRPPTSAGSYLGGGGGPGGRASAELGLHSSDGGRGREDELRGQRNSAA